MDIVGIIFSSLHYMNIFKNSQYMRGKFF